MAKEPTEEELHLILTQMWYDLPEDSESIKETLDAWDDGNLTDWRSAFIKHSKILPRYANPPYDPESIQKAFRDGLENEVVLAQAVLAIKFKEIQARVYAAYGTDTMPNIFTKL